jgi:hypothetical protein
VTEPLYLDDAEIADRIGVGKDKWREIAPVLERAGLPRRDPLFCRRRYWPAVKAFLDRRSGLGTPSGAKSGFAPDGEERFDEQRTRSKTPETV